MFTEKNVGTTPEVNNCEIHNARVTGWYRNQKFSDYPVRVLSEPRLMKKGWCVEVRGFFNNINDGPPVRFILKGRNAISYNNELSEQDEATSIHSNRLSSERLEIIQAKQKNCFEALRCLTTATALNICRSLIVSGPAGIGKSFSVREAVSAASEKSKIHVEYLKGHMRATGLYINLFKMRHKNCVTIIDDADSIFRDEISLNILKAALDSTGTPRKMVWRTQTKLLINEKELIEVDPEYQPEEYDPDNPKDIIVPKTFEYSGSIIFITNLDFNKMIQANNKMSPHLSALMSRSHYLDIDIKTKNEKLARIISVIGTGFLIRRGMSNEDQIEIIKFIMENLDKISDLSLRLIIKISDLIKINPENWKELAKITNFHK